MMWLGSSRQGAGRDEAVRCLRELALQTWCRHAHIVGGIIQSDQSLSAVNPVIENRGSREREHNLVGYFSARRACMRCNGVTRGRNGAAAVRAADVAHLRAVIAAAAQGLDGPRATLKDLTGSWT